MLAPCAAILVVTLLGFFSEVVTGIPLWLVALGGAGALTLIHRLRGHSVVAVARGIGWDVLIFVVGIFIVVIGLRNQGLPSFVGHTVEFLGRDTAYGLSAATGFIAAICSAFFNNHPTAGVMIWVLQDLAKPILETKFLVFAALIGGDLGPKMLPIGSLAALMWFRMLRDRGVKVPYSLYIKIGIPVTLTAVALSLIALNLEWLLYHSVIK